MKKIIYIFLFFVIFAELSAKQIEFNLKQRRAYDQIIVEIWAKSTSSLAPKLGTSFLTLEYDENFLMPSQTQTTGASDSISHNIDQSNPIVDIRTNFNSTIFGYTNLTSHSFAPHYFSLKINLSTLGQGGLAPDTIGLGTFIGKLAFDIIGSPSEASLTKIKWSKGDGEAAVSINGINGNNIKELVDLKEPDNFTVLGLDIIFPKQNGTIIDKDMNYACLTSYYGGGGFPIYIERSVNPVLYPAPKATQPALNENLAYHFQYSLDNGSSWYELGRVTETDRPSSQIGNNPNYRTGQIFNPFNYAAYIITSQNGARITKSNYRNPLRVIWTKDKFSLDRSEQLKLKVTKLAGNFGTNLNNRQDDILSSLAKGTFILGKSFFLQLNGTNEYLKTNKTFSNATQLTVEAWLNLNYNYAVGSEPGIIASSGGPDASPILGSNEGAWLLYLKDGKYPAFRVREIQGRGQNGYLATVVADVCDSLKVISDAIPLQLSHSKNWTHIAATVENNIVSLYVNGELASRVQNDSSMDIRMLTTSHPIWVGINPNGQINASRYLKGGIKEVKVWRVALSQDEIRSRVVGIQSPSNCTVYGDLRRGLELYYSFDAILNDLASDSIYQNGADNINYFQSNIIKNDSARFRPDLPHIKLSSPSEGSGVSNLQEKTQEIRWVSFGLGDPMLKSSNDLFIEYSIDSGANWQYARDPSARDHNGNTNLDSEAGTALWKPYQNNNQSANLRTIYPFSRNVILRVKGNSNNNQSTIEDNSGLFAVAPFFAIQKNKENQIFYLESNEGMNLEKNVYFFEFWLNPYRLPTEAERSFPIVFKCDSVSKKIHYGISLLSSGQIEFALGNQDGSIISARSDLNSPLIASKSYTDEDLWTHIGIMIILKNENKKSEIRFYLDGKPQRADSIAFQLGDTLDIFSQNQYPTYFLSLPNSFSVGQNAGTSNFLGEIRELRFWDGVPGNSDYSANEPTELTYFVQGLATANTSSLNESTKSNLHSSFSFNGGSFVIDGIGRAIEKDERSGALVRVYGNKAKYVPAIPYIKLVEPEYNQQVASSADDLRVRWVGFNYYGLGFYSGADSLAKTPPSLEFSIKGGGGSTAQPYQYVGSKYWGVSQTNSLSFPDSTNYRFKNSNAHSIFAAKLDVSKADPDKNKDGRFDDQGPLPASISNARLRLSARYNIFNESRFSQSESPLFTIIPLSNFNSRILLEGYHKGNNFGKLINNLGSSFETGALKIKLYSDIAGQPGELIDSSFTVFGYDNRNPANRSSGTKDFANAQCYFSDIANGYYWLVVEHLNHLPAMSRFPAPFLYEGDDPSSWKIESGWDFESWNGQSDNALPNAAADPWSGNYFTAYGNARANKNEEGYLSTALIYSGGQAGADISQFPALVGGDVNRDGRINELDDMLVKSDNGTSNARSDISGDGYVNASDRTIVRRNFGRRSSLLDLKIASQIFPSYSMQNEESTKQSVLFKDEKSNFTSDAHSNHYQQSKEHYKTKAEDKTQQFYNYQVFAESSTSGDYIDLDLFIQNQGSAFALANCTFAISFNQNVLKFHSFLKNNDIAFEDKSKGYNPAWSSPLDNAKNKLEGVRTIEIDYDNFANPGGVELTTQKTYLGTLRFSIFKRDEIAFFEWHESSSVHSTNGENIRERGIFNLISPTLLYSLTINRPTENEVVAANEQYTIRWETSGRAAVYIDFSSNSGMLWNRITHSPIRIEDKAQSWVAPNIFSEECLIRIVDSASLMELARTRAPFSIMHSYASIDSPYYGNGCYIGGTRDTIHWFTQVYRLIYFEFSSDGGVSWTKVSGNLNANNQKTVWVIPKVTTKNAVLRMVNSENGKELVRTESFKILNGTLLFKKPSENEIVKAGTSYKIQWISSSVDEFDLELSTDDGASWTVLEYSQKATPNYYNWAVPNSEWDYCWLRASLERDEEMIYDMLGPFSILEITKIEDFLYEEIDISPNPACDFIKIDYSNCESLIKQIKIINSSGLEIYSNGNVLSNEKIHIVSTKEFPSGLYFIIIRFTEGFSLKRIVIAK